MGYDQSSAGLDSAHPGPIDNSNLFKGTCDQFVYCSAKYYYTITHVIYRPCWWGSEGSPDGGTGL